MSFVSGSGLIHVFQRSAIVHVGFDSSALSSSVKCLKSLPNLHTLEMGGMDDFITTPLKKALKSVELPQIKTLILFPTAHPLLQHCRNVEDVACMVRYQTVFPAGFLRSLLSNQDSKVKRLTIPLIMGDNPSRKWFSAL